MTIESNIATNEPHNLFNLLFLLGVSGIQMILTNDRSTLTFIFQNKYINLY